MASSDVDNQPTVVKTLVYYGLVCHSMDLLPDIQTCGLRMRREYRESLSPPPFSKETAS